MMCASHLILCLAVDPHISELDKENFAAKGSSDGTKKRKTKQTKKKQSPGTCGAIDIFRKEELIAFADFSGWKGGSIVKIIGCSCALVL